jgi:hypothetical protein
MTWLKAIVVGSIAGLTMSGIWQLQEIHLFGGTLVGAGVILGSFAMFVDYYSKKGI